MQRVRVDPHEPDPDAIGRAAALLRAGRLVAFPTETVYGLGANALDPAAVQRVFRAKGRPAFNPLIAHVSDAAGARRLVRHWPDAATRLADSFWPGPLTLVLDRAPLVPDAVAAGMPTVAVRVPAHPVALALLRAADLPVVAPSANPSAAVSPTTADHVIAHLGQRVDLVLDAGPTRLGIESTVVDLSGDTPTLLRPGALAADRIEAVLGRALAQPARPPRPASMPGADDDPSGFASPGMLDRHYAPRARLLPFPPAGRDAAAVIARRAAEEGRTVGGLLLHRLDAPLHHPVAMAHDPHAYARELYGVMHRLDDLGCDLVLVEDVPTGIAWDAIRDRLRRAAALPPDTTDRPGNAPD